MPVLSRRRLVPLIAAAAISFLVCGGISAPSGAVVAATGQPYSFNWLGTPTAPQSVVPATWDVQIHNRGQGDDMEPMDAQHGADCGAPPATHPINTLAQGVFICKNHLMTSIVDSGYGEIALTPDHMVDFSQGTASINVNASTLQFNGSDFVELWVTPFADNLTLPFADADLDLQGAPKNALVFSFNAASAVFGSHEGDVSRFDNGTQTHLPKALTTSLVSLGLSSPTIRTTYEMDISSTHIRFGLPTLGVWWTDTNIAPLPFTQAIVQITHHSYNPLKHDPGTGIDTWHWSDFNISNSVPFAIINGAERSIHAGGATTVHFPSPAPANAFLRFSGIGPTGFTQPTGASGQTFTVSYNGGASWVSPALQTPLGTHDEHFSTYWTPIPPGTQTVMFRGNDWWGGPWWARDPAIWALGATSPAAPAVTSLTPNNGPNAGGTTVTLTGTNFGGASAVKFGTAAAGTFAVSSATQMTATSPPGSGTVDVTVTTAGGSSAVSAADRFTYGTPPAPTGVRALAGDGEATLTWMPPTSAIPITGYTITASPGGATTTVSAAVPVATVSGLTNGTPYTFTVSATNSVATGPASLPSAPVTPTAVPLGTARVVLPVVANAAYGGYTTVTSIENISATPANVTVKYFDANGNLVGVGNKVAALPASASWLLPNNNPGALPAGTAGSAIVYSDQPIAAFANEFPPSGDATSYTGIDSTSGTAATLFAPAIANNAYGGYTTGIGLVNLSASAVTITVTYRDGSGAVIKTQTLNNVAGGAYQALYSGDAALALPSGFAGTATITSSGGNLAAVVNETGPGSQFSSFDAVPAGSTTLYAPVALNNAYGGYNTGMAIQNTTGTAGTVTINYYDTSGTVTSKTSPIVANGYLGVYQGTDIPVAGAYTAKITSTVPIAAIVNEVAPSSTSAKQSTAYNTFAGGSSSLHLPLVESSGPDGWSTGEGIMNTGTAATTVTVTYYDSVTGVQVGTPQSLSLQPNAFWGLYQPTGGLPTGTRASAIVTTTAGGQVAVISNESNATTFMSYSGG